MALNPPVELAPVALPDFGASGPEVVLPRALHAERVRRALAAARTAGLDGLVIYGDREHSANVAWASGYDPRFEECLLVLLPGRRPALLVGNEGWAYADHAAGDFDKYLFQSLSLPGQPRDRNPGLAAILRQLGVTASMRLGVAGWKYYGPGDAGLGPEALEIPAWMAGILRDAAGSLINAGALFMDPGQGLRAVNEAAQLAAFEAAACHSSLAVLRVIRGLRPGMTEHEAAVLLGHDGRPLSAHVMLSSGERAFAGLPSPSSRRMQPGDPVTLAYGVQGALNARAGFLAAGPEGVAGGIADYVERLVAPYFSAAVAWWEALGIGVEGGGIWRVVQERLGDPFFGIGLNPGHLIHLDEWLHSPFFEGSRIVLRSGMALQCDIIPATNSPWFTSNIEDGLALADAEMRAELAENFPAAWGRITARRAFMQQVLGIRLRPEVLPFSNISCWLAPWLLSPGLAMRVRPSRS